VGLRAFLTRRQQGDLATFVEEVCRDQKGARIKVPPMHHAWYDFVRRAWGARQRALVLAPFGHGKSTGLALPIAAFELGRDPQLRIKIVSSTDTLARQKLESLRRLIESPAYRRIFPAVRPGAKWTETEGYIAGRLGHSSDPSFESLSVDGKPLGKRADLLLLDDVVDQEAEFSEATRDKTYSRLIYSFLSRLPRDGRVLAVGTPQHADDAYARFRSEPGWRTLIQKVSEDCSAIEQFEVDGANPGIEARGPDLPLWEVGWPREALLKKAGDDPREFARGFRMQAYSEDELDFPHFAGCIEPSALASDWWRRRMPAFVGVDLSASTRTGMAVVTLGYDQASGRKFFLETASLAGGLDDLIAQIDGITQRHDVWFILVESNGVQQIIVDHLEKYGSPQWRYKVESFTTTAQNKNHRALGVRALDSQFNRRGFAFPGKETEGHPPGCTCSWDTLRREFQQYPKGARDDTVMATFFAEQGIHRWGAPLPLSVNLAGLNDR
jgi:hypothetical protein